MLQNARVTDFTVSELLRENQKIPPPPIQIRVNVPGNKLQTNQKSDYKKK